MAAETPYRIEPTALGDLPPEVGDLAAEIASASTALGRALAPETARSLANVVRTMNCYYSNLIEGHNTRLKDLDVALEDHAKTSPERRILQIEARAHIRVQASIDQAYAQGALNNPTSEEYLRNLHRQFYKGATPDMLRIGKPPHDFLMAPGELRTHDNAVGRHVPPSHTTLPGFMTYFSQRFEFTSLGLSQRIVAIAAAHHRFNYIHPFEDGNGRVSRLMSHAMGLVAGIGSHGLWSISRGLARGLSDPGEYKRMMDLADSPRQGDLDGKGNLSHRALVEFVIWFLKVTLDQITFMSALFDLKNLSERLATYATHNLRLAPQAAFVLRALVAHGEITRGEATRTTGLPERTARNIVRALVDAGLAGSSTPKGPLTLRLPLLAVPQLFPGLYSGS